MARERLGDLPGALAHVRDALAIDTVQGNLRARSFDLRTLGKVQLAGGNVGAAREAFAAQLALARATSEPGGIGRALSELATAHVRAGDLDAARAVLGEAMPLFEGTRDQNDWSYAMAELSNVLRLQGDHAGALDAAETAMALDQGRIPEYEARALWRLGLALHACGDTEQGARLLSEARRQFVALGCRREAAEVSRRLDELADADRWSAHSLVFRHSIGDPPCDRDAGHDR